MAWLREIGLEFVDIIVVQSLSFAEGILWKRRHPGGPLGKLTCMWEDGVSLGNKSNHGRRHRGEPERRVAHENGSEEDSEGKMGPRQSGDDRGGSVAQERRR